VELIVRLIWSDFQVICGEWSYIAMDGLI